METLIILGKYILSTALLLLFYWVVLRHRASYHLCRNYLTSIPLLGLLMCILTFEVPVSMPKAMERNFEKVEQRFSLWDNDFTPTETWAEPVSTSPKSAAAPEVAATESVKAETVATSSAPIAQSVKPIDYESWTQLLIVAVSGLLLLLFGYYIVHVLHIRRNLLREETAEGYCLIRSKSVNTPFSFGKTIFLPSELDSRSEGMIVRHEKAHIAHRHYLEVWHIEFWTRLCWFNPILWLCRSELRNVHEFEADRDVIRQGADIHSYQSTLLEMVMNESCPVVNGFNHSFIRQRFIEMKSSTAGTLGRVGKVALLSWVVILFGSFTLRPASRVTETEWRMPTFSEPQLFVLDGELDKELIDTSFKLYLSDEFFHIEEETPFAVVPVVDGKIHYEVPLTQMVAGRLCGMNRDGKPTETKVETYFVPGQKVSGRIYRRFSSFHSSFGNVYDKAIQRTIAAVRHGSGAQSPHYPHVEGKIWEQINGNELIDGTKSVHFAKDKTILHTFPVIVGDMIGRADFSDEIFLEDPHGNRYKYLGHYPESDLWNNIESAAYGTYNFFEPMPKNVEYFNIGYTSNDSIIYVAKNIREKKDKEKTHKKPNFELTITVSQGIEDCGYLIGLDTHGKRYDLVADLQVNQNRQCVFTAHLDSITEAEVTAIFPDGSVCPVSEKFPFVPNEKIELRVYHAFWQIIGGKSNFYKDWSNAKDFCENINRRSLPRMEMDSQKLDYLNQHKDQLGCLYYFNGFQNRIFDELDSLPSAILQTSLGKKWTADAEKRAKRKAEELAKANVPLYFFDSPDNENSITLVDDLEEEPLYQEYIRRGAYVLDKEYKSDESGNPTVYLGGKPRPAKTYKIVDRDLVKTIYKEYREGKLKLD